jgi:hypothetical protein
MTSFTPRLQRKTACALVFLVAAPFAGAARPTQFPIPPGTQAAKQEAPPQQTTTPPTTPPAVSPAPVPQPAIVTNPPAPHTSAPQSASPAGQAPAAEQQQTVPPPVGTAAAPVVPSDGVSASRPAGAAIAPAKQRRKHSLAIRVGLIIGAAVAIGAVTAASLSSPSRPH